MKNNYNSVLQNMEIYASKAIATKAKLDPSIANLSFGEPEFGPPNYLLNSIQENCLDLNTFLDSVKRYEDPKGSLSLREAISSWYRSRYGLSVNPHTEVMITHGGVEAITLAILSTTQANDPIAITDPTYMLYGRTIQSLSRRPLNLSRNAQLHEYLNLYLYF